MTPIMTFASHEGDGWPRPVRALVLARAVNQLGAFAMSFLAVALVHVYGASLPPPGGWLRSSALQRCRHGWPAGGWPTASGDARRSCSGSSAAACHCSSLPSRLVSAERRREPRYSASPSRSTSRPSQALLAEMVAPQRRPQAFGLLGAALAPARWRRRGDPRGVARRRQPAAALGQDSGTCLAAAALILMWVHEPSAARPSASHGNPWRDGRLLVMLGVGTGFAFAGNLSLTALPLTVAARGLDPAETGWLLAAAAVVTITRASASSGALRHGRSS